MWNSNIGLDSLLGLEHGTGVRSWTGLTKMFPGPCFRLHKEYGGLGIFSYVRDIKGRKVLEIPNNVR